MVFLSRVCQSRNMQRCTREDARVLVRNPQSGAQDKNGVENVVAVVVVVRWCWRGRCAGLALFSFSLVRAADTRWVDLEASTAASCQGKKHDVHPSACTK